MQFEPVYRGRVVLFLDRVDELERKLAKIPVKTHFLDYNGDPTNVGEVKVYFCERFLACFRRSSPVTVFILHFGEKEASSFNSCFDRSTVLCARVYPRLLTKIKRRFRICAGKQSIKSFEFTVISAGKKTSWHYLS